MSSKRKCIVILLFIVLVTILFILYNRSQFFFGISYRCTYSVYEVHSKSFKNHTTVVVNSQHFAKGESVRTPVTENSPEQQKFLLNFIGLQHPHAVTKYKKCPDSRILTACNAGFLGNVIWEYMSLFALQELYGSRFNMQIFLPGNMRKILGILFENLEVPEIVELPITCVDIKNARMFSNNEQIMDNTSLPSAVPIILAPYACRYHDVFHYGFDNFRKELRFTRSNLKAATKILMEVKRNFKYDSKDEVTFVGVHYRGGDYNSLLKQAYKKQFKESSFGAVPIKLLVIVLC